ncbi:hypothetical protein RPE78_14685 (plasmid) [Thioclava litoralis]|uniref:Uncharacterized protein n=1 Tax=Thioclava litoralis TaxID=3076557 RepID=A0ABZ1E376_9RHOB|nr:hypothetical protein RPE78_14685 [Thioclava sp. FTW29]
MSDKPSPALRARINAFVLCFTLGGAALLVAMQLSEAISLWVSQSALSAPMLLTLAALGFAAVPLARQGKAASFVGWALGFGLGLWAHVGLMALIEPLPGAVSHKFYTLPIGALALGLVLAPGQWLTQRLLPVAALISGGSYAVALKLSDPSSGGDPTIALSGLGLGVWILLCAACLGRIIPPRGTVIGTRIIGSWLIAIAVLYGSLGLIGNRLASPVPADTRPIWKMPASPASPAQPLIQQAIPETLLPQRQIPTGQIPAPDAHSRPELGVQP